MRTIEEKFVVVESLLMLNYGERKTTEKANEKCPMRV